jgi:hypothetical protein
MKTNNTTYRTRLIRVRKANGPSPESAYGEWFEPHQWELEEEIWDHPDQAGMVFVGGQWYQYRWRWAGQNTHPKTMNTPTSTIPIFTQNADGTMTMQVTIPARYVHFLARRIMRPDDASSEDAVIHILWSGLEEILSSPDVAKAFVCGRLDLVLKELSDDMQRRWEERH